MKTNEWKHLSHGTPEIQYPQLHKAVEICGQEINLMIVSFDPVMAGELPELGLCIDVINNDELKSEAREYLNKIIDDSNNNFEIDDELQILTTFFGDKYELKSFMDKYLKDLAEFPSNMIELIANE